MKSLSFIEIDIPVCSLVYGVAPCTASIPTTGANKCFNCKSTCQDRDHYDEEGVTLRFARPTAYLPKEIECIPNVQEISFTPATISLGENLGTRATLSVTFFDIKHSDTGEGFDKYLSDRDYDPYEQGTFWGKFRARQPFLRGRSIRWITGLDDQDLGAMEARHFVIESFDGPTPDGRYTLVAKDVLKLVDGDRAMAPAASTGFLVTGISSGASSATLSPSGVGNLEYATSGYLAFGGKEIIAFTRSSDALTLTARGQLGGGVAQAHNAQDRVQVVLRYTSEDPADIIYDLMVNYAGVPAGFITLSDWQTETATFLGRLYSAVICEPTSVATLISELIQQAGLCIWWDDIAQKVRLQVLRGIVTDAALFTPDNIIADGGRPTLTVKEQPDKRISRVFTYFGQINPLKQLSDLDNYRSSSIVIDEEAEEDYGGPVIKKILSRWIPGVGGRTVADRLGAILLSRYRDPPRRLTFDLSRYAQTDVSLGGGYRVSAHCFQDETGALVEVPVQVIRLNPPADRFKVEAEEVLFAASSDDPNFHPLVIDSNTTNVNLRTIHDAVYGVPTTDTVVECRILAGVEVTGTSTSIPVFDVGSWPAGVEITLIVEGDIRAPGGAGGQGYRPELFAGQPGLPGGTALYTRYAINLELPAGSKLWAGGGGGGGGGANNLDNYAGGGGGGAGSTPGPGGNGAFGTADSGTTTTGGAGAAGMPATLPGGNGGGPGLAGALGGGSTAPGGVGGAAGRAIDGVSYVTTTVSGGDQRGSTVN